MKSTNKLVETTLESITNIKRAEPSPWLYGKIMHKLQQLPQPVYYGGKLLIRLAAAVFFVGMINAATVKLVTQSAKFKTNETEQLQQMANEYFGNTLTTN